MSNQHEERSPILAAALEHYSNLGTRKMLVPEWVVNGRPVEIYYTPLTVKERQKLWPGAGDPASDVDVLIMKALNAQGEPLFTIADKQPLLRSVDSAVIARIASTIVSFASVETQEKN